MSFFASAFTRVEVADCNGCGISRLHTAEQHVNFKQEGYIGEGKKRILFIAPPPTYESIANGAQYAPSSYEGQALASLFQKYGIDLYQDCTIVPAVPCVPVRKSEKGVIPTDALKTSFCRPNMVKLIKQLRPQAIIASGSVAISVLWQKALQDLESKASAYMLRGFQCPDYEFNCWVFPILNYSQVYEQQKDRYLQKIFDLDIAHFAKKYTRPLPPKLEYLQSCQILTEYTDVVDILEQTLSSPPEWIDFDYEANCLKPQTDGAVLWTISFDNGQCSYAFPYGVPGYWSPSQFDTITKLWAKIMLHRRIKKSAHHINMEHTWSKTFFGEVNNWAWDSIVAQHHINTESGTKGLKMQAFLRFGIKAYNTHIDKFLIGNPINRIHEARLTDVLWYNAQDSFYTRHLRQHQMRDLRATSRIPNKRRDAFVDLYLPGAVTMAEMSLTGLRMDIDYYKDLQVTLTQEIEEIAVSLQQTEEAKAFAARMGRPPLVTSNDDLRILVYDIIGVDKKKSTKAGAAAVDVEVLEDIDTPFIRGLVRYKKLSKIVGTYLSQYLYEATSAGYVHPGFSLSIARSHRSSSQNPNLHNVPKRDKTSKKILRSGIYPHEGFHFTETDYGSQEVRIFACHCKDPVLINYLLDPTTDMHRDQAVMVYDLPGPEWVSKDLRQEMKMGWVFALLYGSYYKACAAKMWETVIQKGIMINDPNTHEPFISVKDHLASSGITTLADFVDHCRAKETKFWDIFHVTKEYHEKARQEYFKRGYVETMFGTVRGGILSANKVVNTPTQGTGFQCLLWSSNELRHIRKKEKWLTCWPGQIHDSLLSYTHPTEIQHVFATYERVMCHDIRERFDWVIVPFEIEIEMAPIDAPWSACEPYQKVNGVWQKVEQ